MSSKWFENSSIYEKNTLILIFAAIMICINVAYAVLCFLVIYPSDILASIPAATQGIIDQTFLIYIPLNLLNFIFFLIIAKISFQNLGLCWKNLWIGILVFLGIWLIVEVIMLIIVLAFNLNPIISTRWTQPNVIALTIGGLIREFLGNSLFEEILYRGVLLPQLYILLKKKGIFKRDLVHWLFAILLSQLTFALMHLPSRIIKFSFSVVDLIINLCLILLIGIIFALAYLSTRNLIVSIGIHALNNLSITLIQDQGYTSLIFLFVSLLFSLIILLIRFSRQRKESKKKTEISQENQANLL